MGAKNSTASEISPAQKMPVSEPYHRETLIYRKKGGGSFPQDENEEDENVIHKLSKEIIQNCDFFDKYRISSILKKISTSDTVQLFAIDTFTGKEVFVKLFFDPEETVDNSLLVEVAIYSIVVPELFKNNTPFLINFVSNEICSPENLEQRATVSPKFSELYKELQQLEKNSQGKESSYRYDKIHLLATEKVKNFTDFYTWLQTPRTMEEYEIVFFQIYWSLACFAEINLKHNDFHLGNILVEKKDKPQMYFFKLKYKYVKLYTDYYVRIFDWDRSNVTDLTLNLGVVAVGPGDVYPNPGLDAFKISCHLKLINFSHLNNKNQQIVATFLNYFKTYKKWSFDRQSFKEIELPKLNMEWIKEDQKKEKEKQNPNRLAREYQSCFPPGRQYYNNENILKYPVGFSSATDDKNFEFTRYGKTVILDFNLPKYLNETPMFDALRVEVVPNGEKIFILPTNKEKAIIDEAIKSQYPKIIWTDELEKFML